jgi:hypothetical protein
VRWRDRNRLLPGPWTTLSTYTVIGRTSKPSGLTGLTISTFGGMAYLRWDPIAELDVRFGGRIEFRHSKKQTGATWAESVSIARDAQGSATQTQLPLKAGTYFARVFDSGGRPAETVQSVSTKQANVLSFANVSSITEDSAFNGDTSNVYVLNSALRLPSTLSVEAGDELTTEGGETLAMEGYSDTAPITGTYDFAGSVDLGSVKSVRVTSDIGATIINERDLIDTWGLVDDRVTWDGTLDALADCYVQVRHTDDDPTGSPTWSAWERLDASEIEARGFEFRAILTTDNPSYNIRVDELGVTLDEVA